jgi:hypothetical protein
MNRFYLASVALGFGPEAIGTMYRVDHQHVGSADRLDVKCIGADLSCVNIVYCSSPACSSRIAACTASKTGPFSFDRRQSSRSTGGYSSSASHSRRFTKAVTC